MDRVREAVERERKTNESMINRCIEIERCREKEVERERDGESKRCREREKERDVERDM